MPKDLKGRELPKGIYQRKDGRYEARALINGIKIQLYNFNLKELKVEFEKRKEEAKQGVDKKLSNITLDEWFEEWFTRYKVPKIKETSITPMKTKYRANFGRLIETMKVADIRNMDIQDVINTMQREGRATSSMRDALGRVRECLEFAKNNRIISENPCFDITVPWENVTKERRFLSQEEQNRFLQQVENNWYKEMFLSQKKKQDKIKKELGKRYRSDGEFSDLVFVTSMGSPVFRHHAEKEVKKVVKAINEQEAFDSVREQREPHYFEDLYPHAIRHTFCSRCFQLNMNPKVVQKLMGHQHYSTTIDIYTHVMQDDIDSEVCKLESAIATIPEE